MFKLLSDKIPDLDKLQPGLSAALTTAHNEVLKRSAKNLVGSVKSGALNYIRDIKAFDSSLVPNEVTVIQTREKVDYVKEFKAPDILGLKKPEWNNSTHVIKHKSYADQVPFAKRKFDVRTNLDSCWVKRWKTYYT